MSREEPIDLSELDPMRDPERWQAFMDATMLRADAVIAARVRSPLDLIASWSRPLVLAASVAVSLLIPVELMLERRETGAEQVQTLVRFATQSALGEELPTGEELSRALGQVGPP